MIQLGSNKEKLSWPLLVSIALYLVAAILFVVMFWPSKRDTTKLQTQIDQLLRNEQNLLRIAEQKPSLEKKQTELEQRLHILARDIPSQYDLPEVLEVLTQLATFYGLSIDQLSHVPLKVMQGNSSGVIPLTLEVSGSQAVLSYLVQIQQTFPSLRLAEVALGYGGDKQFQAEIRADLQVLVVDHASYSHWELPKVTRVESLASPVTGFGLPFEIVAKFLSKHVQVLGVVDGNGQTTALLSQNGTKRWVKVGDRLDEALVISIFPGGVVLDVDGVLLKLTMGG